MKQFNNTAILTSKNPEAFLNFTFDACEYWIIPEVSMGTKILYVNGLDDMREFTPETMPVTDWITHIGFQLFTDSDHFIHAGLNITDAQNDTGAGPDATATTNTFSVLKDETIKIRGNLTLLGGVSPILIINTLYSVALTPGAISIDLIAPNDASTFIQLYTFGVTNYTFTGVIIKKAAPYSPLTEYAVKLDATNNIASFHVYGNVNYKFDTNLRFSFYDTIDISTATSISYDVSILNRPYIIPSGIISPYNNDDILIEDEASYLLMRTNPKFTGNIVFYIDGSSNMFLDTFKISDTLSNKKYRHQQISSNSVLSSDIRNIFSSMPLGELYRVDVNDSLSIAIPGNEYKDQYNSTYNYGARLIKDELYTEDYGILAPLWINSKLPDYFATFRLDGVYNTETYDNTTLTNLALKYLEESDLIKSWSLKSEAPLGKYLGTHLTDVVKIQAPVFLSLTDPILKDAESDPNTWYGIAVDKGVLTGRSETPYFFNQKTNNFTDLNAFVSQGFERNTLLCPNLLNLQYIFSDEDVSLYTMHRYFGLYLTENILYNIAYYSDTSKGAISIISLDRKDSSVFIHSSIFNASSGDIISEYKNRIFVLNDEVQLQRITNVSQINETIYNSYVSKPYKNIFTTEIEKTNINPFIVLTLNNTLEQGEHLRIINKTQNKIWEIYSVDISTFTCDRYCTISEESGYPTIYRTYFDINGNISYQCQEIQEAFDRFGDYLGTQFRTGLHGTNWVSLILDDDASISEDWVFQRITSSTLNNFNDPLSGFNNAANPNDITFFGRFTPNASDFTTVAYDSSYGPIDFELYGNRQSIMINFFKRGINNLYSFDSSQNILDKFKEPTLYQGTDKWYKKILNFDVSNNSYQYIKDPLHLNDKVLIMTGYEIQTINNKLNAYSIYPLNISLMGINPVKDIDYTVYDSSLGYKSEYWYKREDDVSTFYISVDAGNNYIVDIPGSYIIKSGTGSLIQNFETRIYDNSTRILFNTFDTSAVISANTTTLVTYGILNGSNNYKSYKASEEHLSSYYDSSILLKYGLKIPLVSKWVGLGTDSRNNPLRLILDISIFDVSTNFVADSNNFSQEISYPVFKYLTPGTKAWESYIFYDINDVVDASNNLTFKDAMFEYPYIDYFSKLVYSNYNVDATKTRSSIVYYNGYKNSLDTIITGLNLSIKLENAAKSIVNIKDYDRYRFSFISTPSKNKNTHHPIEVIINENTKTILMIWYQGNDELNYNKRYSTFLPGKSLLDPSNYGFVTGTSIDSSYYSFIKTPFFVNNSLISKKITNLYDNKNTYSSTVANPYAQFNKNLNEFNSIWNSFGTNTITGNIFNSTKSYNTFPQYTDYTYNTNNNTYGDYTANYGYEYNNNKNLYLNSTTNIDVLNYLLSPSYQYVMYYILRGSGMYTNIDFGSNPMTISINPPRKYGNMYTYNGWYKPKFNSILEFNSNEQSELINIVDRGFIFSNTNLRLYNDIPQLWYTKLATTITTDDISVGNAISYVPNFNVFKSLWDADYFIKDNDYVDGYNSPDELPSFFGSKLIKLPNELPIENWDITTASSTESITDITLTFNLTRAILNKFKSNGTFIGNWSGLIGTDNVKDSYIKNTILTYYNLSTSKIKIDFYYKPYDSQRLFYTYDSIFINDNKQNFDGQLLYENDEYIYKMIIPNLGNYSYYIKFTMTEK